MRLFSSELESSAGSEKEEAGLGNPLEEPRPRTTRPWTPLSIFNSDYVTLLREREQTIIRHDFIKENIVSRHKGFANANTSECTMPCCHDEDRCQHCLDFNFAKSTFSHTFIMKKQVILGPKENLGPEARLIWEYRSTRQIEEMGRVLLNQFSELALKRFFYIKSWITS